MSVQLQKLDGKEFSVDDAYQTAVAKLRQLHTHLDAMPTPAGTKPIPKMQATLDRLGVEKDSGASAFLLSGLMQVGFDVAATTLASTMGMHINQSMMMAFDTAAHVAMEREAETKNQATNTQVQKSVFKRKQTSPSDMLMAQTRKPANTNGLIIRKQPVAAPATPKPASKVQRKHLIEARQKLIQEIELLQAYRSCGVQGVRMTADGTMYGLDKFVNKADEARKKARDQAMALNIPVPKHLQRGPHMQPFA